MFVDDEPQVLRALKRDYGLYSRFENVEPLTVDSGEACLEYLRNNSEACLAVVTDQRMPGMAGTELLAHIQSEFPDVGRMLVTAYSDIEAIQDAVSASISSFLLKPWDPGYLVQEVDRTVESVTLRRNHERYMRELEQQLRVAGEFQRRLLTLPPFEGSDLSVDVAYRAVEGIYCSGDYYDAIALERGRYLLLLGDVSGHGVKPAFITGMLKVLSGQIARERIDAPFSTGRFLEALSRAVFMELPDNTELIISMAAVLIDTRTHELVISNAGHPPVGVVGSEGCELIWNNGPAIGMDVLVDVQEEQRTVHPGDRVVMFTDGIWDVDDDQAAPSPDLLKSVFQRAAHTPVFLDTVDRLLTADSIVRGNGRAPVFRDDVTILTALVR